MTQRVDLDTVTDPLVRSLVDRFEDAEVSAYLFDSTVDTRIPTYMAVVADRLTPPWACTAGTVLISTRRSR